MFIKNTYKGKVVEFDLINNLTKFACKNNKDHTISNVTRLFRKTKFVRDPEDKLFIN